MKAPCQMPATFPPQFAISFWICLGYFHPVQLYVFMRSDSSIFCFMAHGVQGLRSFPFQDSNRFTHYSKSFSFILFYYFIFLATPRGLWDLSSPTRDWTQALAVRARSPNHWTTREFPSFILYLNLSSICKLFWLREWHTDRTSLFFFLIYYLFIIYFSLCWVFVSAQGLSLVAASGGHSSSRCAGLSLSQPLLLWCTGSRRAGSAVVAQGPSCPAACGIFPDQGSNPCALH